MLRPRVLVVDHRSDQWKQANGVISNQPYELQVLEDGLDAYMELGDSQVETVLIREDLPGVPGRELAQSILDKHPESKVVVFGCNGKTSSTSLQTQCLNRSPSNSQEAAQFLEDVVSSTTPV